MRSNGCAVQNAQMVVEAAGVTCAVVSAKTPRRVRRTLFSLLVAQSLRDIYPSIDPTAELEIGVFESVRQKPPLRLRQGTPARANRERERGDTCSTELFKATNHLARVPNRDWQEVGPKIHKL